MKSDQFYFKENTVVKWQSTSSEIRWDFSHDQSFQGGQS